MTIKERYQEAISYFTVKYPVAETELKYMTPFELTVAVILSAQCTDKRVNMITPALLAKFPDAESMAKAEPEEIFEYIKSCSYPNNKAKHLSGMSRMLVSDFEGKVPEEPEILQKLVMAVDTHVFRVSNRLGLVSNAKTTLAVELQLTSNLPVELMHEAHHWLILHGRYICKAKNPLCDQCGLSAICKFYAKSRRNDKGVSF